MSTALQLPRHGVTIPIDRVGEFCWHWKIRRLEIFGSYLREGSRPGSDIDLHYDFRPEARWNLFELATIQEELGSIVGRPVELVGRREIEESANYLRRREILNTAMPLHEEG